RSRPLCEQCPLTSGCLARKSENQEAYPGKKPKKTLPVKTVQMLLIQNPEGQILLQQRPHKGIWGGLWSLPELALEQSATEHIHTHYGELRSITNLEPFRHTFSHY